MKIQLFFVTIFCTLSLRAMHENEHSRSMPIGQSEKENKTLKVSCSPGNWASTEQSSLEAREVLEARQAHAIIEHQESIKKSHAVKTLAFMGNQSLLLLDSTKKTLSVSAGDPQIDSFLEKKLQKLDLSSSELPEKMDELIAMQALLLNQIIRFSESKKE
jgi:hypothetical protein